VVAGGSVKEVLEEAEELEEMSQSMNLWINAHETYK
jgi:hypothetical protein